MRRCEVRVRGRRRARYRAADGSAESGRRRGVVHPDRPDVERFDRQCRSRGLQDLSERFADRYQRDDQLFRYVLLAGHDLHLRGKRVRRGAERVREEQSGGGDDAARVS